jgi:hypothetical protein
VSCAVRHKANNRKKVLRATAVAIIVGLVLVVVTPVLFGFVPGPYSRFYIPLIVSSYGVSGAALGFLWPERGWRLGAWLAMFWAGLLLIAALFSDPVPWNPRLVINDLMEHGLIMIAGPGGAAIGAVLKRHQQTHYSGGEY